MCECFSKYSSDEAFTEIEEELLIFSKESSNIVVVGDFNSRTSNLPDYIIIDDDLLDILDITDDVNNADHIFSYLMLKDKNIPLDRSTQDTGRVNKYGTKLFDLCKQCNLFIANGRLFADRGVGRTTCKNICLIDYLLLSPYMFDIVSDFEIVDFNPMFSDVHNRLHFTLYFPAHSGNHNTSIKTNNKRIRWKTNKAIDFARELENDKNNTLFEINKALDALPDKAHVTVGQVNCLINDLCNLFTKTANTVFSVKNEPRQQSNNSKPWFNKQCKLKRNEFHKAKNRFRHDKTECTKSLLNKKAKEYRKELNNNFCLYQNKCANELRSLAKI